LKALAAHDNGVPFYVALPSPTIDFSIDDGIRQIPIEQRSADEVATMTGRTADGRVETVRVVPEGSPVANYAFDVTPARLVTGLITERGLLARSVLHLRAHSRSAARDIDAGDVGTYPRSGLSYRGSRLHVQYRHRNRRRGSDRTGGRFACGDQRSRGDVVVSLLLLALALTLGYDNWRTGAGWESTGRSPDTFRSISRSSSEAPASMAWSPHSCRARRLPRSS
jgi:hypothetical protein